ncbi:MAG TPA: Sir2 family NAD-dependent protein deacetylase [Candidatus Lokiarchaeia archaeon]|nr:Sir2 family NAD-dependent protein deacetylase [Candidatus Lokiarchaeia archaeon]
MTLDEIALEDSIETAARWIVEARHVVVFTGAGLSTASGLPDYRGPDGVWTRRDKGLPPPAPRGPWTDIKPNEGHFAIVDLEKMGKVQFLISQNVDGLHRASGFPQGKLAELHGNHNLMRCLSCDATFTKTEIGWSEAIHGTGYRTSPEQPNQPRCPDCGGRVISSVVNFEDPLPQQDLAAATMHSKTLCDLFIVLGSSLVVTPAARMPLLAKRHGARLIINNKGETPYDQIADLLVSFPINDFFPPVVARVCNLIHQR